MSTPNQLFTNNAVTLLAAPISSSATSLTVMSGYGSLFPLPIDADDFFLVTLEDQSGTNREIIRVTSRTGDTFNGLVRAQEGTIARNWTASLGNDTLVDHRVTAETMRQALLQPVGGGGSGSADIVVQQNGVSVTTAGQTLNFTGDVSVTNVLGVPTINIAPSASAQEIHGATTSPLNIDPGWTLPGDTASYANDRRGFKFFVTITMPANQTSQTFEVLGNISGNIAAGTEVVTFNRSARVGFNFAGSVNMVLDRPNRLVQLTWTNNEANPVVIQCVRIQHTP